MASIALLFCVRVMGCPSALMTYKLVFDPPPSMQITYSILAKV
jgi:hypothetical protein